MKNVHEIEIKLTTEWEKCLDDAFKKKVKETKVDGFRKGTCPKDIFIKRFGIESLYMDAVDEAVAVGYKKALEDNKDINPVIEPKVDIKNIPLDEIQKTVELINKLLIGTPIDEVRKKLELEIKPIINKYVKQHEAIYNAFYDVFNDFTSKNVSFVGKNNMLKQPEFNNVEKIKKIFDKFESPETLDFIEEDKNDINVYIGKETNLDDDVTIIKTKYNADGEE